METSDFSNVAQGVQNIVVAVAVLAGGVWALLRSLLTDEFRRFSALHIDVNATQTRMPGDGRLFLTAIVRLENKGKRSSMLRYGTKSPFCVTPAYFNEQGHLLFGENIYPETVPGGNPKSGQPIHSITVRPAQTKTLSFVVMAPKPGLYRVSFDLPMTKADASEAYRSGVPENLQVYWTANSYVVVNEDRGVA